MLLLECVSLQSNNKHAHELGDRELVYDVIGQCGQGYQREGELSPTSIDIMHSCTKRHYSWQESQGINSGRIHLVCRWRSTYSKSQTKNALLKLLW